VLSKERKTVWIMTVSADRLPAAHKPLTVHLQY